MCSLKSELRSEKVRCTLNRFTCSLQSDGSRLKSGEIALEISRCHVENGDPHLDSNQCDLDNGEFNRCYLRFDLDTDWLVRTTSEFVLDKRESLLYSLQSLPNGNDSELAVSPFEWRI